ncbi:MAG: hypothetical protein OIF32_05295 [Campylobacterales bacterium]|nr:hypothetical protein [Campylobacterales bacterium]
MINVNFDYTASVFSKSSNSFKKLSDEQLLQEDIKDLPDVEVFQAGSFEKEPLYQIAFRDTNNDRIITLNLNEKNMLNLIKKFGKDDFFVRDDKTIRLEGKAESFVSGWYDDIVDNRGEDLVGTDLNLEYLYFDKKLKSAEGEIDKDYFSLNKMRSLTKEITEDDLKGLTPKQIEKLRPRLDAAEMAQHYYEMMVTAFESNSGGSYEEELNRTLNFDKNADGSIDFRENLERSIFNYSAEEFMSKVFEKHKEKYDDSVYANTDELKRVKIFNFQDKVKLLQDIQGAKSANAAAARQTKEEAKKVIIEDFMKDLLVKKEFSNSLKILDLFEKELESKEKEEQEQINTHLTEAVNGKELDRYRNLGSFLTRQDYSDAEIVEKLGEMKEWITHRKKYTESMAKGFDHIYYKSPEAFQKSLDKKMGYFDSTLEVVSNVIKKIS